MSGWFEAWLERSRFVERYPHYAGVLARLEPVATDAVPIMAVALRRLGEVDGPCRLLVNLDAALWGSVLEVNLGAQLRLTRALLDTPGALADGARIVAVSSTSGIAGNRGQTSYAASKAGLVGIARSLARELGSRSPAASARPSRPPRPERVWVATEPRTGATSRWPLTAR